MDVVLASAKHEPLSDLGAGVFHDIAEGRHNLFASSACNTCTQKTESKNYLKT